MVLHHLNIFLKKKFKRKCFAVKLKIIQISSPISNVPPSVHPVDGINALNYFFFKLTIYLLFFLKRKVRYSGEQWAGRPKKKYFHCTQNRERGAGNYTHQSRRPHSSRLLFSSSCSLFLFHNNKKVPRFFFASTFNFKPFKLKCADFIRQRGVLLKFK